MNKYAVTLSFVVAAFLAEPSQAQGADGAASKAESQTVVGSEKKTPAPSAVDSSKPESKLGLNTKAKSKAQPVFDNTNPGPYGAGLKKVPKKKPMPAPSTDKPAS